ncbi:uncharacterized protein H6S33_011438 [Morchella sextelata]|uniref:uncharacterized protein n=1 Tax=Morchella sextelata TaxID=1174677 RepID=UPI001D04C25E|nr:uncharacterized protein H6S33_011438 [Morchella sextelata]KAH0611011.1 hypothetical protein H6S33_011438 [Morchella sextelata]
MISHRRCRGQTTADDVRIGLPLRNVLSSNVPELSLSRIPSFNLPCVLVSVPAMVLVLIKLFRLSFLIALARYSTILG